MSINKMNLRSSTVGVGKKVTQIIHFVGGEKRTFFDIETTSIVQGQFTKLGRSDGTMIMVNDKNVLCVEVFNQEEK